MKKNEKYVIALLGIIGIFFVLMQTGYLAQYGIPPLGQLGGGGQVILTDQQKEDYAAGVGRWNVFETVVDSLDISSVHTSGTNYSLYWYARHGGDWIYLETGNNKYVDLTAEDGGVLWVIITIPSGQVLYVDYQETMRKNPYITQYQYIDVDNDGVKEFAFCYDMRNHQIPNSGYPGITFKGFLITYDSSFTGLNNLGNSTAIGGTTTTLYKEYYLSFASSKKGVAIYKVEVKITTTDETKVRLKKLNIPGLGYLDGSAFIKTFTASDIRYTYTISTTFDGALYLKYGANAQNRFDSTLGLEFTLSGADDIAITLTYYLLKPQTEAGTSTYDSFNAQYS
jgi:hypothetical protein